MIARRIAVNGVAGPELVGNIFPDETVSRSGPMRATTVTPVGCPSTAIGVDSLQSGGLLMGPRNGSSHPAALIAKAICWAKAIESKSSAKYRTSTLLCGASWRASTNAVQFRLRGSNFLIRSSASAARALAVAIAPFAVSASRIVEQFPSPHSQRLRQAERVRPHGVLNCWTRSGTEFLSFSECATLKITSAERKQRPQLHKP